jgi:hypothetical protein
LDVAHLSVKDLEEKVSLLERSSVTNRDTLLRGVQEKHKKEILSFRSQLESITAKLSAKVWEELQMPDILQMLESL